MAIPIEKAAAIAANLVKGDPPTTALVKAGYSPATAERRGSQILTSPNVRKALRVALDLIGVDDDFIASTIKNGMEAIKSAVSRHDGKIEVEEIGPDWSARAKFTELAAAYRYGFKKTFEPPEGWQPRFTVVSAKYANVFLGADEVAALGEGNGGPEEQPVEGGEK